MIIKHPCVIDVSHHDPLVPGWTNTEPGRIVVGVYAKLTQGTGFEDETAKSNRDISISLGLPFGPYHFFEPNDISRQVDWFISRCEKIGSLKDGVWLDKLPPALDLEYTPTASNSIVGIELAYQVKVWMDLVEIDTGVRPILYSSLNFLEFMKAPIYWTKITYPDTGKVVYMWLSTPQSKPPSWAGTYDLWLAQYPYFPDQVLAPSSAPDGWPDYLYWQYSDKGIFAGLPSYTDVNQFNGTITQWIEYSKYGTIPNDPPPIEPPTGETDMLIKVGTVLANTLNVRSDPDSSGTTNIVEKLYLGYLVTWDREESGFAHLVNVRHGGLDGFAIPEGIDRWAFIGDSGGYIRKEFEIQTTVTEPVEKLVYHCTMGADGYETVPFDLNPL